MEKNRLHRILVIGGDQPSRDDFCRILSAPSVPEAGEPEAASPPRAASAFEVDIAIAEEHGLRKAIEARDSGRPYAVVFVDVGKTSAPGGAQIISRLWEADPNLEVVLCAEHSELMLRDLSRQLRRNDRLMLLEKPFGHVEMKQMAVALSEKWRVTGEAQSYFTNLEALIHSRTAALEQSLARVQMSENLYRLLFDSNPTPILTYDDATLAFVSVNDAAVRHYGYSKQEFLALTMRDLAAPEELAAFIAKLSAGGAEGKNSSVWRHRTRCGKWSEMEIISHHIVPQRIYLSLAVDATERLSLEAQLRQSQKMESIGQLAGGIAHDFNNLLTVVNGHASLLVVNEKLTAKGSDSLKEIIEAGKRAGALTRQLMTFSRKHEFNAQVVDLNEVVNHITKMLRRILGEDVSLQVEFAPGLPAILADLGMIEQVLLNLAVNSRDAMPRGGRLRIRTAAVDVGPEEAKHNPEASPGRFVCLTFGDTGSGIAPEHLSRIFEPFFTTKEKDRGTGLGLATVYGIVKQHKGWITVESAVGQGTAFFIYLPASNARGGALQLPPSEQKVIGGTETILVVEDEGPLLKLIHYVLESHGYKVLGCGTAKEALAIWKDQHNKIDLLLTDLILPEGMAGTELAKILQQEKPGLKVLCTSGYDAARLAKEFPEGTKFNLIQKPFHARRLAETVFEALTAR